MAGIKADVSNNLHFISETEICYVVGHNIVFYNTEEKTQRYISGTDGSEAITAIAVSHNKAFLAVAERTERAPLCMIYDTKTLKRKKVIVSTTELKKENKEYISVAFSPKNDKLIATLTNIP